MLVRCISPGQTLYVGGRNGFFGTMSSNGLEFQKVESMHSDHISLADNNGFDRLLLGDEKGTVSLWDVKSQGN